VLASELLYFIGSIIIFDDNIETDSSVSGASRILKCEARPLVEGTHFSPEQKVGNNQGWLGMNRLEWIAYLLPEVRLWQQNDENTGGTT
jgi:hypothetical protein